MVNLHKVVDLKVSKDKMDLEVGQVVCPHKMGRMVGQARGIGMVNLHKMGGLKVNQTANKMGNPIKSPPRSPHRKNRQAI